MYLINFTRTYFPGRGQKQYYVHSSSRPGRINDNDNDDDENYVNADDLNYMLVFVSRKTNVGEKYKHGILKH